MLSHYKYNELVNIIYESDDESFISSVFDMLNAIYYLNKAQKCITLDNIINLDFGKIGHCPNKNRGCKLNCVSKE